ncbi:helix-turn-helix transcriptional regulator [Halorussus salinus]|uniref:helix-turn-helix transcriptional regulator n=1 Tax=Halorussus salinus TaxID=1364935 RepID=UPI001091F9C8|nr:transcriptional regulator FilR1 domain-containing protein [Halorussus salinus]
MTDEPDSDLRECISTVVKRTAFLDRLADEPTSKRDLRDELDLSRSTVYKAVRELEALGLVTETDAGVALTLVGRLLAEECRAFESRAAAVTDAASLLSALPADVPVTTDLLVGAETVRGERHAPTGPVEHIDEVVRRTDRVVGFTPVVLPQYVDMVHEEVVADDLTADLVLEAPVVEYLRENHDERLREALASGNLSVRRTGETLPFGLVVAEGEGLVLIVYDETGDLRGVLLNDTEAALDWGTELFRTYWERAGDESG